MLKGWAVSGEPLIFLSLSFSLPFSLLFFQDQASCVVSVCLKVTVQPSQLQTRDSCTPSSENHLTGLVSCGHVGISSLLGGKLQRAVHIQVFLPGSTAWGMDMRR